MENMTPIGQSTFKIFPPPPKSFVSNKCLPGIDISIYIPDIQIRFQIVDIFRIQLELLYIGNVEQLFCFQIKGQIGGVGFK